MKFITELPLSKQEHVINYESKIVSIGSCFSENIGAKFNYFKFQNCVNPFGILFHPKAIEMVLLKAINNIPFTNEELFYYNEIWQCFDAHSSCNKLTQEALLTFLNTQICILKQHIKTASHVVVTMGTAWVYTFLKTQRVVANCHKVPQKQFKKTILSIQNIERILQTCIDTINTLNPNLTFIFTVSPVRHLKDGFVENSQSKAHLITAVHQVIQKNKFAFYFPSYEIMMDELRDYRFYASDMLHPNTVAINYIWNKFKNTWMDSKTQAIMQAVAEVQKGLQHKPFNPHSEAHKKFKAQLQRKQQKLQDNFPFMLF